MRRGSRSWTSLIMLNLSISSKIRSFVLLLHSLSMATRDVDTRRGKGNVIPSPRGEFLSTGVKHFNAWKGISLWSDMRGRISAKRVDIDMLWSGWYSNSTWHRIFFESITPRANRSMHLQPPSPPLPSPLPLYIRATVSARFIFLSRYTFYFLSSLSFFFSFFCPIYLFVTGRVEWFGNREREGERERERERWTQRAERVSTPGKNDRPLKGVQVILRVTV